MNLDLKNLNIIDLISEKHAKLRKIVSKTWIDMGKKVSPIQNHTYSH